MTAKTITETHVLKGMTIELEGAVDTDEGYPQVHVTARFGEWETSRAGMENMHADNTRTGEFGDPEEILGKARAEALYDLIIMTEERLADEA